LKPTSGLAIGGKDRHDARRHCPECNRFLDQSPMKKCTTLLARPDFPELRTVSAA
jgi:hypothetical protein